MLKITFVYILITSIFGFTEEVGASHCVPGESTRSHGDFEKDR